MDAGVMPAASLESLSLGQLEDRLQLVMTLRQHLFERQSVCQHDMRVAVESIGLELPAQTPLNSFTQAPSQTNFKVTYGFIQTEEQQLINKVRDASRRELKGTLENIAEHIQCHRETFEVSHARLKIVAKYLTGYTIPEEHPDSTAQAELTAISSVLDEWRRHQQLGQDTIGCVIDPFDVNSDTKPRARVSLSPYQIALNLWEPVGRVISNEFLIQQYDDEVAFLQAINMFVSQVRVAGHISPDHLWSPNEVVEHTLRFIDFYSGPIPYKLQEQASGVHRLLQKVDSIEDQRTLTSLITAAKAVRDYLSCCWRLENICVSAVDTSVSICQFAGHLRVLTT